LHGEYDFETTRREDAGDAVAALAERLGSAMSAERAQQIFDAHRDF
jgi:hypothetical protein